jgi:hypothetical protein
LRVLGIFISKRGRNCELELQPVVSLSQAASFVLVDVPLLKEIIYSCRIGGLGFVVALEAVLFIEGCVLSDVLDVD